MIERKVKSIDSYKEVLTVKGDTFDSLALQMYGDERRSSDVILFNPEYADVLTFDSGITIRLPIINDKTNTDTLPPWYDEDDDYTIYEEE